MKKWLTRILYFIGFILILWTGLTIWAQYWGPQKIQYINGPDANKTALLVYNPDPIYNLDEQVCLSFAEGLKESGYNSIVATTTMVPAEPKDYDLYVFCANTYNWAPDWEITNFIEGYSSLASKNVIAITLGSGSTIRAKRLFEKTIRSQNANLIASKTLWLMRPNDEDRMDEQNVVVATDMVKEMAFTIGQEQEK